MDLEIGAAIAVGVAFDKRVGACELKVKLASFVMESLLGDKDEVLISRARLGIDCAKIDVVEVVSEIRNNVAGSGGPAGFGPKIEIEDVALSSASQEIAAKAANQEVEASAVLKPLEK